MAFYFVQFLTGLASAASLFLVASGLSIIFGVTRIVNFAHGAFYMLGAYVAFTLTERFSGALGFWGGIVVAALLVAALGVNQKWLFTSVFALGVFLAALGGALQIPRDAVHHALDLRIIVDVFVVVVIGGLGSIIGAFVAAVLVSELNAFGILIFPKISIILVFLVMPVFAGNYALTVGSEIAIFVIFAASLHFLMSVGGLASFGHAAYFGLGAYGVAFLAKAAGLPMIVSLLLGPVLGLLGAAVFGFFAVQLSGVYFAMLTLAFAQIVWSIAFQWVAVTGGDNGILGVWPEKWAASPSSFYWLSLAFPPLAVAALRVMVFSPFGFALRATRDSPLRS